MNRISGWKRGVATGVEFFANDSGSVVKSIELATGRNYVVLSHRHDIGLSPEFGQ
jgi:hypothetical protein